MRKSVPVFRCAIFVDQHEELKCLVQPESVLVSQTAQTMLENDLICAHTGPTIPSTQELKISFFKGSFQYFLALF